MDRFSIFAAMLVEREEYFSSGHRACQGCAEALAVRLVMKVLGRDTIVAMATGCMEIISTPLPLTAWKVPWIHVAFENAAPVASGCEAGMKVLMRKGKLPKRSINFVAMGGDGATADIGIGMLSGVMERGHNMIYICYDNEAYMNTGIQRSSSTPYGARTTTSPHGRCSIGQQTQKKDLPHIAAAHDIPYVATACPSFPFDLMEKVKKAVSVQGPVYIHILSVCPTGWGIPPDESIRLGRLAVNTGVFPLYEVTDGVYRMTLKPDTLLPVEEYLKCQGRFNHLSDEDVAFIQARVTKKYERLLRRCEFM